MIGYRITIPVKTGSWWFGGKVSSFEATPADWDVVNDWLGKYAARYGLAVECEELDKAITVPELVKAYQNVIDGIAIEEKEGEDEEDE
jgi:hypothetical protein